MLSCCNSIPTDAILQVKEESTQQTRTLEVSAAAISVQCLAKSFNGKSEVIAKEKERDPVIARVVSSKVLEIEKKIAAASFSSPQKSIPIPKKELNQTKTISECITVPVKSKTPDREQASKPTIAPSPSTADDLTEEMSAEILAVLQNIQERLAKIESGMGQAGVVTTAPAVDVAKLSLGASAFDDFTNDFVKPFKTACDGLGGDAAKGGELMSEAMAEMRSFIVLASACKEPPASSLPGLLAKLTDKIKAITASVQRNDWEKHTKTLSEGGQSLNWLIIKPSPCDFIMSYADGADYWANNIRKEFRTTNPAQIAFCDTFKTLLLELVKYVKEYHKTGLTWNPKGVDVSAYSGGAPAPAKAASVEPTKAAVAAAPKPAAAGPDLFAALNKGGNITAGLKTVTKDQQTWRSEYKGPAGDAPTPAAPVAAARKTTAAVMKGPPKLEFQNAGSKWLVENQTEKEGIVEVKITEMKETVYIYGCEGATITIKGKCKSIVVDGCKKTKVFFDTAMASCEVINCQRMQIQCNEKVAAVAIDKTDGIIVFLPITSLGNNI